MSEEEVPDTRQFVMLYDNIQTRGGVTWALLDDDGVVTDTLISWKHSRNESDMMKRGRPGSIWQAPYDEEQGLTWTGRGEYVGQYPDEDRVSKWWARHRVAQLHWKMLSKSSKAMNNDLLTARLEPVRDVYRNLRRQERRVLLAYVIEYITS